MILGSKVGLVTAQRVFLIGTRRGHRRFRAALSAVEFRAAYRRRSAAHPARSVRDARTAPRRRCRRSAPCDRHRAYACGPDAVYIVTPWSETVTIDDCVDEFLNIRVEHPSRPQRILDRFENVRIVKHGSMASLQLTRAPLTWFERMQKRLFDVMVAAGVLVALLAAARAAVAVAGAARHRVAAVLPASVVMASTRGIPHHQVPHHDDAR